MPLAFESTEDCPLPEIPRIASGLVRGCDVNPAPAPIFEAPEAPNFDFPDPIGCAPISWNATASYNYATTTPQLTTGFTPIDGDNCFPELDFNLEIPCPPVTVNTSVVNLPEGSSPYLTANTNTSQPCANIIDLELGVPAGSGIGGAISAVQTAYSGVGGQVIDIVPSTDGGVVTLTIVRGDTLIC